MDERNKTFCEDIELSPEDIEFIDNYAWWVEIFSKLFIGITGVFLNFITIIVLASSNLRNNFFNRLLICLAIFDNFYLFCEISEVFRVQYYTSAQQLAFVRFVYPVRSIFMYSSIYMNIVLTLERYHAIAFPAQYRGRSTINMTRRLLANIIPVLVVCIAYNSPKFFELEVSEALECKSNSSSTDTSGGNGYTNSSSDCTLQYYLRPTAQRTNHYYVLWYINISNLLITAFIPVGILIYLITKIKLSLKRFLQRQPSIIAQRRSLVIAQRPASIMASTMSTRHNRNQPAIQRRASINDAIDSTISNWSEKMVDMKKTFILFSIVFVFLFCHSLRFFLNMEEFLRRAHFIESSEPYCDGPHFWVQVLVPLNQLLLIINPSAHFLIYVFFDQGFQVEITKLFENLQRVLRRIFIIRSEIQVYTPRVGTAAGSSRRATIHNSQNIELGVMNNNGVYPL